MANRSRRPAPPTFSQFEQLAADWDTTRATGRDDLLRNALTRGGPLPAGPCLELGSGTGLFTPY